MNLAVTEKLAHLHEEDLVLVVRPLENGLPEEEGVAWNIVRRSITNHEVCYLTFKVVLKCGTDKVSDFPQLRVFWPSTNGELSYESARNSQTFSANLTLYSMLLISVKPAS